MASIIQLLPKGDLVGKIGDGIHGLMVRPCFSTKPATASHRYPSHPDFEKEPWNHKVQIVQHLGIVGG
jgi:hypothetical protein